MSSKEQDIEVTLDQQSSELKPEKVSQTSDESVNSIKSLEPQEKTLSEEKTSQLPSNKTLDSNGSDGNFLKPHIVAFKLPVLPTKKSQSTKTRNEFSSLSAGANLKESYADHSEHSVKAEEKLKPKNSASAEKGGEKESTNREKRKIQHEPSPAEKLQIPPLPYKEPSWGGIPVQNYNVEILKGGKILQVVPLNEKSFHVFGRLEICDVTLDHPSLSRYHLVLQYKAIGDSESDPGFYLYDLDSTHGSYLNKVQLKAKKYCRIRVGHMFKLGGSTRLFILQGPQDDQESESVLSLTELKEMKMRQLQEAELQKMKKAEEQQKEEAGRQDESGDIDWGMGDEAEEEIDMSKFPFEGMMTQAEKEATYIKDPKKTLRGYFEREGMELEYDVTEKGTGFQMQYVCKVELPIDNAEGEPIFAEAIVSGKKKEAVIACALEACRILDTRGVLRQAVHESRKRKKKNWASEDYYDSDDDTFLDRTGHVEKKREKRMMKAGVIKQEVDDYDSLILKLKALEGEVEQIQKDLQTRNQEPKKIEPEEDELDALINRIKSGKAKDKMNRGKMKLRLIELRKDQAKLLKLIKLVQPTTLPGLQSQERSSTTTSQRLPTMGALRGKPILQTKLLKTHSSSQVVPAAAHDTLHEDEEEEEEEEDGMDSEEQIKNPESKKPEQERKDDAAKEINLPELLPSSSSKDSAGHKELPSTETKQPSAYRVYGPQLGPNLQKKPKRVIGPSASQFIQFKSFAHRDEPDEETEQSSSHTEKHQTDPHGSGNTESKFSGWIPPDDQKGDGKTHLNAKFGY